MKFPDFIKSLQVEMNHAGEHLDEDGICGARTIEALLKFNVKFALDRIPMANLGQSDGIDLVPALAIIKEFEGLDLNAYLDPVGIPTIGWGTIVYPNGLKVKMGDKISEAEADEYLMFEVRSKTASMKSMIKVPISNNAFCALTSFCYNLGTGALAESTLLKLLNEGETSAAADQFEYWNHAGGKVLVGLTRRREAEKALFLS